MLNLVNELKKHNLNPVFFWPVGVDWRDKKKLIKSRCNYDAIIVNGEGSIHHNRKKEKPNYLAEIANFAKSELKIPAYLINSSIYENSDALYEKLKRYEKIFVRESTSYETLKSAGIESVIVPDLTFATSVNDEKVTDNDIPYLITDSTFNTLRSSLAELSATYGWDFESMKVNKENSLKRFFVKVEKRAKKRNMNILGKIFSIPAKIFNSIDKIRENNRELYSSGYRQLVDHDYFVRKIKSKSFVLTGRFHTVTLCIKTGTPFVAIESNTPKISGMLNDVFQSDKRLIQENEIEKFMRNIPSDYLTFCENENDAISRYNSEATAKIKRMFDWIASDIRSKKSF